MNVSTSEYLPNQVNRTESITYNANGKGVNVSLVLRHFGVDSKIIGIFGGFTGEYIVKKLKGMHHEVLPIWVEEETRINVFINDKKDEYNLVSPGSFVPQMKQTEVLNVLRQCDDITTLIISGSLPTGVEPSMYDEIIKVVQEQYNANVIIDIASPKLKDLLKYKPLLIKPNDEELKAIFDLEVSNDEQAKTALNMLHKEGAQQVLLTMGDKGLYYSNSEKIYHADAPSIKVLSSACAGDSCLSSFVSGRRQNLDIEILLKRCSAIGANVAEGEGIGLLEHYEEYMKQVTVREVK